MVTHKTCCIIGHRNIEKTAMLSSKINTLVEWLIKEQKVDTFAFGSKSAFNDLCYDIVSSLKEKYPIKRVMMPCKNETCCLESEREKLEKAMSSVLKKPVSIQAFDEEIEFKQKYVSGKASYIERNYKLIDMSDYCIFYYDQSYKPSSRKCNNELTAHSPKSGTALAYNYAIKKNKTIFNTYLGQEHQPTIK